MKFFVFYRISRLILLSVHNSLPLGSILSKMNFIGFEYNLFSYVLQSVGFMSYRGNSWSSAFDFLVGLSACKFTSMPREREGVFKQQAAEDRFQKREEGKETAFICLH